MQAAQLHHEEEQASASGPRRVPQVLLDVPEAHTAQGDTLTGHRGAGL
jgi:hypothetical protein